MMKVALIDFGVAVDFTIQLANALTPSAEVHLLFGKAVAARKLERLDNRVHCEVFDKPNRDSDPRNPAVIWKVFAKINEISPDILHIQESKTPWFELGLLACGTRVTYPSIVTTIHDARIHPGDHPIHLYEQTRHISIKKADVVIVHSHHVKRELTARFHLSENGVRVLPLGEVGSFFRMLSSRPVPLRDQHTVLFFGRVIRYKGLDHLVEAMPVVRSAIPDVKLILAGRGGDLQGYARKAGSPCEVFPGHVPEDRVAELFQRAGVLVLPYIEASQSGVANIGLGLGTPVIASAIGGLKELIRDGQDGLLVPPGDSRALAAAMIRLVSDRELCSAIRENIRARCLNDLSWDTIANQTLGIYHEVLSRRSAGKKCA